jgi:DNA-binding transcriptional MerR regulator/methylmalonyl-CoA mutase cobalamin-binding subunit
MTESLYPVRVVVSRTGLTAHVLRAWERRYGAVKPHRTETNRRLYSASDIQRLHNLKRATDSGYSISQVACLNDADLRDLLGEANVAAADSSPPEPIGQDGLLAACQQAVRDMDCDSLMSLLETASVSYSQQGVFEQIVLPLVRHIGDGWQNGELRVAHEHLALSTIRTFVGNMLQNASVGSGDAVLVAGTLSGQSHEIGALIVSCLAASQGWRPAYLGPGLPAEEMVATAEQLNARVIALSFVYPGDDVRTHQQIRHLGRLTRHSSVQIIAGGRAIAGYAATLSEIGAEVIQDLSAFRRRLDSLRTS